MSEEGRSFWQIAGHAFARRWANMIALGYILFLALLAIFVPFIANGHPYTMLVKKGAGWERRWPLFENLSRLDLLLLGVFVGAVACVIIFRRTARTFAEREERVAARAAGFAAVGGAVAVLGIGLYHQTLGATVSAVFSGIGSWLGDNGMGRAVAGVGWPYKAHPAVALALTLGLVGGLLVVRAALRKRNDRERGTALARLGIALAAMAAAYAVGVAADPGQRISPHDYRAYQHMIATGEVRSAIFPIVHWGYAEQEPLSAGRLFEFPSADHWLGTDGIGRDAFARLLWSTRVVMGIGFVAETIAVLIGVVVGSLIGYFSGKVDLFGMRLIEIFESIPTFILILIFVATYGRDIFMIMVILGLTGWTGIARFVRAEFLRLRNLDYVHAAKALGLPVRRVIFRHMLPNGLTPVIVTVTFGVAGAVMSESGLSFLGVGVEPPTPSWGSMLNEAGNPAETFRWWLAIAPGLMIFLTVFAYNVIGEGLRDAIDPRLNRTE